MTGEERRQRNTLTIELFASSMIRWLTRRINYCAQVNLWGSCTLIVLLFYLSALIHFGDKYLTFTLPHVFDIYLKTLVMSYCRLQVHSVSQFLLGGLIKLACELQLQLETPKTLVTIEQHAKKPLLFVFIKRFTYQSEISEQIQKSAVRLPTNTMWSSHITPGLFPLALLNNM